jgi:G2/M phase-specific E3 ubiquitin-protein ligase
MFRAAVAAGYFFKCPLCNNKDKFEPEMKQFGVFIPEKVQTI